MAEIKGITRTELLNLLSKTWDNLAKPLEERIDDLEETVLALKTGITRVSMSDGTYLEITECFEDNEGYQRHIITCNGDCRGRDECVT